MKKSIPYLIIIGLLFFILLQNRGCIGGKTTGKINRDTVIKYVHVTDTFTIKPKPVKSKKDTIWLKANKPDTTYEGLLKQYNILGNKHFETKFYSDTFAVGKYGHIFIDNTVKENKLISSKLRYDLKIPEKTITIKKTVPYRQLYLGLEALGNSTDPLSGVLIGGIFKTKKDHLYGLGVGYVKSPQVSSGDVMIKASIYWPIKKQK